MICLSTPLKAIATVSPSRTVFQGLRIEGRPVQKRRQIVRGLVRRGLRPPQRLERVLHLQPRLRLEGVHVAWDVEVELVLLDLIEADDTGVLQQLVWVGIEGDELIARHGYVPAVVLRAAPGLGDALVALGKPGGELLALLLQPGDGSRDLRLVRMCLRRRLRALCL